MYIYEPLPVPGKLYLRSDLFSATNRLSQEAFSRTFLAARQIY